MHVRHYYSIANFLMGVGTKIYDNYFSSYYDQTYQQLFGQFTAIARGQVAANVAQGILPQNLINQWGNNLAQQVATEWKHYVWNLEHSPGWDGDAVATVLHHTSLWNFMSEWSTVTTIAAGVIESVEKINLMYQVGFDSSKLSDNDTRNLVEEYGLESLKPLKELGVNFYELGGFDITDLVRIYGLESLKPLKEVGVDFAKLNGLMIMCLVKIYGLESIKPLKDAGVDFSKLTGWVIKELVKELGIEGLKALKEVGVDYSKLDVWEIGTLVKELGIESLKAVKEVGVDYSKLDIWEIGTLVKELGIDIEITEFYKIIDHMTIPHDIIERHIGDSKVEQDTISVIIEEVEVNNLQGIVTELNTPSWSEDFAITT